jgi:ribosomal protein S27E
MVENESEPVRCPKCRAELVRVGVRDAVGVDGDIRRRHAYWCPSGCRGPEPDGTFEFFECPGCGSHETVTLPRGAGMEEVECRACGTITSLQLLLTNP